ncbi:DUF1572 family protein [Jeotgalibacillus terrae]|uniref:DUF1572 family protein n=1 Tax=Jeotgalibacillus terrae TaxID=587735 RepID=A0ABW5ZGV7_9BACL|nr:DUF1572 family protein [Jeotgalibacillus terrae]MBM7578591.1 putative damage-inducible protein DinB [Jeotgalibacillus terrae]
MIENEHLSLSSAQFHHFKERAEKGLAQLSDEELYWRLNEASNSIAMIMKHISGNMHSHWKDFLSSDGEKAFRDRDMEFVITDQDTKKVLMNRWESGWTLLFDTLESLNEDDLQKVVALRKQPMSVLQAIQTEIAHISYHTGQILFLGKQMKDHDWTVLSIPKNGSEAFNRKVKMENEQKNTK